MMCVSGRLYAVRSGRTVYIWYVYRWRATNAGVDEKMVVTWNCEVIHFKNKKKWCCINDSNRSNEFWGVKQRMMTKIKLWINKFVQN